jgi:SAM-dependent methyltransferase
LALTAKVAREYDEYDRAAEGTHMECVREAELLEELTELHQGGVAVNLGCANGMHVTEIIGEGFQRVIGYDISPDMIACAKEKFPGHEFYVHDLDNGIPLADESADLVVANFGAASEVCSHLWSETARVLRPGGRAYFSFYNQQALVTRWWTPWSNSYRITINTNNDTIMVPIVEDGGTVEVFWIHGRSADELDVYTNARAHGFELRRVESSSPLWDDKPREFFRHTKAVESAMEYEREHAHVAPYLGQYLRVVVKKKAV